MSSAERPLDFQLDHNVACTGRNATYAATLFHLRSDRRFTVATHINLGKYQYGVNDAKELVRMSLDLASEQRSYDIPPEACVALNAARACARARHVDAQGILGHAPGVRIERAAAIAFVSRRSEKSVVRPLNAEESATVRDSNGIGYARRPFENMVPLKIVSLPLTPAEKREYIANDAIQSSAQAVSLSQQPYVLLHHSGNQILEHLFNVDDLR